MTAGPVSDLTAAVLVIAFWLAVTLAFVGPAALKSFKEWRHRRRWPAALQLDRLRRQIDEDARWMAHDPKIAALCQRYADMAADDWMFRSIRHVSDFRREIGAEPRYRRRQERSA